MHMSSDYELVEIANEFLIVPVGERAVKDKNIITVSNASAYLLKQLSVQRTEKALTELLIEEYDVERTTAINDIKVFLKKMIDLGVVVN